MVFICKRRIKDNILKKAEAYIKTILLLLLEKKNLNAIESGDIANKLLALNDENRLTNHYKPSLDITYKLSHVIKSILEDNDLNVDHFISSLEITLAEHPNLFMIIRNQIMTKFDKRAQHYRREEIKSYIVKEELHNLLKNQLLKLKNPNIRIKDSFLEFKDRLEELVTVGDSSVKDHEIIDINNENDIERSSHETADMFKNSTIFKTGFSCLNNMLQGGFRRGEFVCISALSHNYKSSFIKSLFLQIARLNTPVLKDPKKKPLLIFLSLEEELRIVMMFFYVYLKYLIEGIALDPNKIDIDPKEMKAYIIKHFTKVTGFEIKIFRKDPSEIAYDWIVNLVDKFNNTGYDVQGIFIDYLAQISTKGLVHGTAGAEYRDLFKRVRNALSKRDVLCITPHQLSPAAKNLQRAGLTGQAFTQALINKGYFEFSSKLDQEMDVSIFVTKHYVNKKPYLGVQLDKHRIPTIAEDQYRYFDLEFPKGAPIPEDRDGKTACQIASVGNEDFDF